MGQRSILDSATVGGMQNSTLQQHTLDWDESSIDFEVKAGDARPAERRAVVPPTNIVEELQESSGRILRMAMDRAKESTK